MGFHKKMNALGTSPSRPRNEQAANVVTIDTMPHPNSSMEASCTPEAMAKSIRQSIAARAARSRFLPCDLFADPAWDMLLELYALECEQRRTSVSKLCIAAAVPATTALRWIDKLHVDELVIRSADPLDARRVWVSLSKVGRSAMKRYFEHVHNQGIPL